MQTKRLYFIDALRAFAITMMLQGHFIDTLLDPIYKNPDYLAFEIWSYFRGITAPTFFTISGLVFTYLLLQANAKGEDLIRVKKGLFRGLLLLAIGYMLRMNILCWLYGSFDTYFLVIDVLQCIGLSLIILVCLHVLLKKYSYLFSIVLLLIGIGCFISEPLYRNLEINNMPLFIANYMTTANGSVFTILPWFGYSALGAFISTVFFRNLHRKKFKSLTVITFFTCGFILILYSTWILKQLYNLTNIDLILKCAQFNYLFIRFGNVLVLFGLFYSMEQFLKQSIIGKIGKKTLSIYVIHFIILYGSFTGFGLKRYLNQSLSPTEAVIGALTFILIVCVISFNYAKTNGFIYKLFRKMVFREKKLKT